MYEEKSYKSMRGQLGVPAALTREKMPLLPIM
jgi:hypothetical protein